MAIEIGSDSNFLDELITGMARAVWVSKYADYADETSGYMELDRAGCGGDWMDSAPDVPAYAYVLAGQLISDLMAANPEYGCGVYTLADMAAAADGIDLDDLDVADLGHYLAMESMGHGVCWFDSHAEFPLVVPYTLESVEFDCTCFGGTYAYEPGCYGDGACGMERTRGIIAGLLEDHDIDDYELCRALRAEMSDDDSETTEALERINDLVPDGCDSYWFFRDGDLVFGEDDEQGALYE